MHFRSALTVKCWKVTIYFEVVSVSLKTSSENDEIITKKRTTRLHWKQVKLAL